jgi:hypothetical protein
MVVPSEDVVPADLAAQPGSEPEKSAPAPETDKPADAAPVVVEASAPAATSCTARGGK